jgi:hypothetical protein
MISEEIAVQIERDLLKALDAIKTEKGMTDLQWGESAFKGERNGRRKVQNLKHEKIRLRVGDFVKLCDALEANATRIFDNALEANKL